MIVNATKSEQKPPKHKVYVLTAAAPPPSIIFKKMENLGFEVMHVYGLTETYGHILQCAWNTEWDNLTDDEKKTLQDQVKADWAALDLTGYESWTFDEDICAYKPPSIYPNDGKSYEWDTTNQEWKELDGT